MAISYNIYANDGRGGDVDYDTPVASTSLRSWSIPPPAIPSDTTFGVRAFDTTSGIEEANTDARVRIAIDPAGNDVTARPNGVVGLSARATAGGTCWVAWGYDPTGQGGPPVTFDVSLTAGGATTLVPPPSTVAYSPGVAGYGCSLSGLSSDTPYTIQVRATGPSAILVGPASATTMNYGAGNLQGVDSLVAVPSA